MQLHAQYYYQQLPPQERAAYHGMLTCLRELTPSARIPRLPMETLSTLFFQLRLDHPEIFYAVGFSCRAVPEAAFVEFWPEYRFETKRAQAKREVAREVGIGDATDAVGTEDVLGHRIAPSLAGDIQPPTLVEKEKRDPPRNRHQ